MLYNLRRQVGKSNFNLYGAFCLLVWAAVKTRDMQANPCHVKTLFLLKKCRHGGFSGERERERESQRECIESFTVRSQEVGVGFRGSGKVVEVHVRKTALGLTRVQQSLFFTHLATFSLYCSWMGRRYRAKWGFSMVGLFAWKSCQKRAVFSKAPGPCRCNKLYSHQVYLLPQLPNMTTILHSVFSLNTATLSPDQRETITLRWSQSKDNQTKKDHDGHKCNYFFVFFKEIKNFIEKETCSRLAAEIRCNKEGL